MASTRWRELPADEAVPRLVEQHGGQLYRLALRFCGTPADAEDLVQQTFLQAFRKWKQFRGEAEPTTWLYTIAARGCERARRRRSGEPRRLEPLESLLPSHEPKVTDVPADVESPLDAELRREMVQTLERAIGGLPAPLRMALVLKDIVELPIKDVAAVLGLKAATVKTRVHRARLMLRRELSRTLPAKSAPPPGRSRQICLDLLKAKQEALDRGQQFPVPPEDLCERCRSLFATLDLGRETCRQLGQGDLPAALRRRLLEATS